MTKSSEIDSKPQLMRQQYDEYKSDFDKCTKKIQELNTQMDSESKTKFERLYKKTKEANKQYPDTQILDYIQKGTIPAKPRGDNTVPDFVPTIKNERDLMNYKSRHQDQIEQARQLKQLKEANIQKFRCEIRLKEIGVKFGSRKTDLARLAETNKPV